MLCHRAYGRSGIAAPIRWLRARISTWSAARLRNDGNRVTDSAEILGTHGNRKKNDNPQLSAISTFTRTTIQSGIRKMIIPTEPIGSIPRPQQLIEAMQKWERGQLSRSKLNAISEEAVRDTIRRFEATGSPIITDGEQNKPSFATYPIYGARNLGPDGISIPFADGHTRQLPRLTAAPFRYTTYASSYLKAAKKLTNSPLK